MPATRTIVQLGSRCACGCAGLIVLLRRWLWQRQACRHSASPDGACRPASRLASCALSHAGVGALCFHIGETANDGPRREAVQRRIVELSLPLPNDGCLPCAISSGLRQRQRRRCGTRIERWRRSALRNAQAISVHSFRHLQRVNSACSAPPRHADGHGIRSANRRCVEHLWQRLPRMDRSSSADHKQTVLADNDRYPH